MTLEKSTRNRIACDVSRYIQISNELNKILFTLEEMNYDKENAAIISEKIKTLQIEIEDTGENLRNL